MGFNRLVVLIEQTEDGYVAEDMNGFTYGVGKSPMEAVGDWGVALRGKYAALSDSADRLVPYLADQLKQIKDILEPALHEPGNFRKVSSTGVG